MVRLTRDIRARYGGVMKNEFSDGRTIEIETEKVVESAQERSATSTLTSPGLRVRTGVKAGDPSVARPPPGEVVN